LKMNTVNSERAQNEQFQEKLMRTNGSRTAANLAKNRSSLMIFKILLIPAAVLLFAAVILLFVPVRWNITKTLTVQVIENLSEGTAFDSEITLDGEYTFYMFRPDRFEGSMEIAAFPEMSGKSVSFKTAEDLPDGLVLRSWRGSKLESEAFGMIWADVGMKKIVIFRSDEGGGIELDGSGTCAVIGGEASVSDAVGVLGVMKERYAADR